MLNIILLGLLHIATANINITSINGNLFIEDIGKIQMYHDHWNLIIGINVTNTAGRLNNIKKAIQLAGQVCDYKCNEAHEIELMESRLKRLQNKEDILSKLLGKSNRPKRGLANFVGDISKTLFGTLNNNDLEYINNEFDKLYTDNKNIASALTNNTRILKLLLDTSTTDHKTLMDQFTGGSETIRKLKNNVNDNTKGIYVNSKLVIGALLIDELNEDIDTAINAINDGKHGIIHPQLLTPRILRETINKFEEKHRIRYHFDNTEDNYQHIIDISSIQVAIIQGLLTYVIKMPVLEQEEGIIKHVIPIPEKIHNTFLALIPEHEYLILYKDSYSPIDTNLLDKCKQINEYKICERRQPNYRLIDTDNCDSSLLKRYAEIKCNKSPYLLHKETFIYVQNGYILIPTYELEIDILCGHEINTIKIKQATLITGEGCKLHSHNMDLKLPEIKTLQKIVITNVTYKLNYNKEEIEILKDKLIQLPQQLDNNELMRAKLSLDDTENMLNKISSHRRIRTWSEKSLEWLGYLGYSAIGLVILYVGHKCGILNCIKSCIPSKFCLFCVKTKINTNATPHVVTYSSMPLETPLLKNKIVRFSK